MIKKYIVLQGQKSLASHDYDQLDSMGEFTNFKEANKFYNKIKKQGDIEKHRFYQTTVIEKQSLNNEGEILSSDVKRIEEYKFYGNKYWKC